MSFPQGVHMLLIRLSRSSPVILLQLFHCFEGTMIVRTPVKWSHDTGLCFIANVFRKNKQTRLKLSSMSKCSNCYTLRLKYIKNPPKMKQHLGVKSKDANHAGLAVEGATPHPQCSALTVPMCTSSCSWVLSRSSSLLKGHRVAQIHLGFHPIQSEDAFL